MSQPVPPFSKLEMPWQVGKDPFAAFKGQHWYALPMTIAKSDRNPGFGPDGKIAADLTYGDYNAERIRKLRNMFALDDIENRSAARHFQALRYMATSLFATGDLDENIQKMIDRFQENTGQEYSSTALDKAAREHKRYVAFRKELNAQLPSAIARCKGNLNKLVLNVDINMRSRLLFNTNSDKINGLTIAVNDVWAWTVEITQFLLNGKFYTGQYRVTMYDHFGLDEPDVDNSKIYGVLAGFRSWFILQHYVGFAYRPFITKIALDESFSGVLP